MKHHSLAVDFSNLEFEKIDTEVFVDEAKEQEEIETGAAMEKDLARKEVDEGKDTDELLSLFSSIFILPFFSFWKTMVALFFLPLGFEALLLDKLFATNL